MTDSSYTKSQVKLINTKEWLDENKNSFLPPVCNKLMHNEQLIIMFVGGPNQREDYHIEEGEELFYQIKGDMCVKIIENGQHKDIHIKEGEFFLLPARIPHSPQRTANSVGLVIERKRLVNETDAVRWYVPKSIDVLYEKWFHCKDLGVELIPLIQTYFASEEYKTKQPLNNVLGKNEIPFELNQTLIQSDKHGPYNLFERISRDIDASINLTPCEINLQFEVKVLKQGKHSFNEFHKNELDLWLWQLNGSSSLTLCSSDTDEQNKNVTFATNDSLLVKFKSFREISVEINEVDAKILVISQNPKLI